MDQSTLTVIISANLLIRTSAFAFLVFLFLPDFPQQAKWLSAEEKQLACDRLRGPSENSEVYDKDAFTPEFSVREVLAIIAEPKILLGGVMYFCLVLPAAAFNFFAPTIIRTYTSSAIHVQLLSVARKYFSQPQRTVTVQLTLILTHKSLGSCIRGNHDLCLLQRRAQAPLPLQYHPAHARHHRLYHPTHRLDIAQPCSIWSALPGCCRYVHSSPNPGLLVQHECHGPQAAQRLSRMADCFWKCIKLSRRILIPEERGAEVHYRLCDQHGVCCVGFFVQYFVLVRL